MSKKKAEALFKKAHGIAIAAHEGQKRWDGKPYIIHPEAVAEAVEYANNEIGFFRKSLGIIFLGINFSNMKAAAILHDVVEDTTTDLVQLEVLGIPKKVIKIVDALSKRTDESYCNYIVRVNDNPEAGLIKLADIQHNSLDLKNRHMKDKYELANHILIHCKPRR